MLKDIQVSIANYFNRPLTDFFQNGQDMILFALNQVRRKAELEHDFEFQRVLATVSVDGVTGGSLDAAVLKSDGTTPVEIKSIVEVGVFDSAGNFCPVEWTTTAESLERQRQDNPRYYYRYPTDAQCAEAPSGQGRFIVASQAINQWPKAPGVVTNVGLEVYQFSPDWVSTINDGTVTWYPFGYVNGTVCYCSQDLSDSNATTDPCYMLWWNKTSWLVMDSAKFTLPGGVGPAAFAHLETSSLNPSGTYSLEGAFPWTPVITVPGVLPNANDPWTSYGAQYLQWAAIVQLNHLFKTFVFRQEGNLPPPEKLRDEGLQAFIDWDANKFEQFRRHYR